jgi:hypothetical protein
MKTFGKKSFSSFLKVIILVSLVLEVVVIIGFVVPIIVHLIAPSEAPLFFEKLLYIRFSQVLFWTISFFVTIQLWRIINNFENEILFDLRIVKWLKNISFLFLLYFILNWILILIIPAVETNNYRLITAFTGADFKFLFLSAFIFLFSQVFKRGYDLQEQSNLTI